MIETYTFYDRFMVALSHSNRVNHKVSKSGDQLSSFLKESPTCVTFRTFLNELVKFKKKKRKNKKKESHFALFYGNQNLRKYLSSLVLFGEYTSDERST